MVELKSGSDHGFEQLDRMVQITPTDLVRYGRLSLQRASNLASHRISFAQVVNTEFIGQYLPEFERVKHSVSLVSIDSESIRSRYGRLADRSADKKFWEGISLAGCRIPTKLIPVLPTTDDKYSLIESVVDAVRQQWVNNVRSFTPNDIAAVVFRRLWTRFDTEAQGSYLKVARGVLKDMSKTDLRDYLRAGPGPQQSWTLMRLPESIDRKQLTKEQQRFSRIAGAYKQRRLQNEPYAGPHHAYDPNQLTFDDLLESESEDSE